MIEQSCLSEETANKIKLLRCLIRPAEWATCNKVNSICFHKDITVTLKDNSS